MGVEEFLDFMPSTIVVEALLSLDASGKPTYDVANPVSFACRIQMGNHIALDKNGREVVCRGTIYVGTTTLIPITSRVTMLAGYTVSHPPIIESNLVDDEDGIHHVKLEIG